ncbi:MAG: cyclase family protein [Firmicutes bacterium]|nr:cyclase family protein [Bacillota bacterium]
MISSLMDITRPVYHGMPVWPGDPDVRFTPALTIPGIGANVTSLGMGTHSGTHIDAPSHCLEGAPTVDEVPLESLVGPCLVIEFAAGNPIGRSRLAESIKTPHPSRILMKNGPGAYLDEGGAAYLVEQGIVLVGTEEMSIESPAGNGSVHACLLAADVVILESIDLSHVPPGEYRLIALPLRLMGVDGAPCRAVLTPL